MQKIAIHSVPRSGSTWLSSIFDSHPKVNFKLQPLFSYAFKDYLNEKSTSSEIDSFFNKISMSNDDFINQIEGKENGIIPNFDKEKTFTHICYKEVRYHHILENMLAKCDNLKLILLIRNPLAVLYSWSKAPKEFKKEWYFEDEWLDAPSKNLGRIEEYNGYNKWKATSYLFLKLKKVSPNSVYLLTYSDLLKQTNKQVSNIFSFCGLKMVNQTKDYIIKSKSLNQNDAYSVFKKKSKDDAWRDLPNHIIEYIKKDLDNTVLEQFLDE